ncbi:hypothetical protein MTO96_001357 [Rhipicephalus appendiculatus]
MDSSIARRRYDILNKRGDLRIFFHLINAAVVNAWIVWRFNVGDRVLCAIGARRWTLDPRFEGLYAIVGFRGKDIALIRRAATSGSDADTAVNIEQLCLYHERGDDADELADTSIGLQSGRGA